MGGVAGELVGGGCCAKRGKLAEANRIAKSAVPDFMNNPPSIPTSAFVRSRRGHEVPETVQVACQTKEFPCRLPQEIDLEAIGVLRRKVGVISNRCW